MGFGRFVCVFFPFALTALSIVCLLIPGLAGVTSSNISILTVDTKNLSISADQIASLASDSGLKRRDVSTLTAAATSSEIGSIKVTASDLGLADTYSLMRWNYVATTDNKAVRSTPAFNWAANATNTSAITTLAAANGITITIPSAVTTALNTFATVARWTQIVFVIACGLGGITLILGVFSICSRVGSCCAFIVSGFSTVAAIVFAALVTVMATTVTGALESFGKQFGLEASVGTTFLALVWLAAAASLAGAVFWVFTICCCAPDRRDKHRSRAGEVEKPFGGYTRVHDPFDPHMYEGQSSGTYPAPPQSFPMQNVKVQQTGVGYEPYSHHGV